MLISTHHVNSKYMKLRALVLLRYGCFENRINLKKYSTIAIAVGRFTLNPNQEQLKPTSN